MAEKCLGAFGGKIEEGGIKIGGGFGGEAFGALAVLS